MKKGLLVVCVSFFFVFTGAVLAADFKAGTPKEAKILVEKAVAYSASKGKEAALKAFNAQDGGFVDRDLYIFALDLKGITLANGGNPKLVGKNMIHVKDTQNKPFIKDMVELAKTKGSGWVDYKWTHPVTKKVVDKTSYIQRVGDYLLGCGAYKN